MTKPEITEPDWVDPEEWGAPDGQAGSPADAPEADAAEQSRPLRPAEDAFPSSVNPEVNEADAVEQSRVVVEDDEYDR